MYYVLPIEKVAVLNVSMLVFSFKGMPTETILENELLSMTSPLLVDLMPLHLKASNIMAHWAKMCNFGTPKFASMFFEFFRSKCLGLKKH